MGESQKRSSSLLPIYSDAVDDDASVSLPVDGNASVPVDSDENQASASVPIDSDENRASVSVPVDENSTCAYIYTNRRIIQCC